MITSWVRAAGRRTLTVGLALTLVAGIAGCSAIDTASAGSSTVSAAQPPASTEATAAAEPLALLATIPVKGKAPKTGYDRTEVFGSAWKDVDGNGCSTRDDALALSLTQITKSDECQVESGTLNDPYTGKTINFVRGVDTSSLIQVDHVIALSNAWQTGAQQISQGQREALANDQLNLIVVDGPTNSSKGDGDTATWLPPVKSYRCTYVTRQIQVKAKYGLWVTSAEHDAMANILGSCTNPIDAPVAVTPVAPVEPAPAPAPVAPAPATDIIHPGSWCNVQGATGVSDAGKTYTCGKKPADAAGKFHWNS